MVMQEIIGWRSMAMVRPCRRSSDGHGDGHGMRSSEGHCPFVPWGHHRTWTPRTPEVCPRCGGGSTPPQGMR